MDDRLADPIIDEEMGRMPKVFEGVLRESSMRALVDFVHDISGLVGKEELYLRTSVTAGDGNWYRVEAMVERVGPAVTEFCEEDYPEHIYPDVVCETPNMGHRVFSSGFEEVPPQVTNVVNVSSGEHYLLGAGHSDFGSIRQPPPVNTGVPVGPTAQQLFLDVMAHQRAKGIEKYGVPLCTYNGRKSLMDALGEMVDGWMYIVQSLMEQEGEDPSLGSLTPKE